MRHLLLSMLLLSVGSSPFFAALAADQPLEGIETVVLDYLHASTADLPRTPSIEIGRIDPRLRLADCSGNMQGFTPPGARQLGNVTVGVRCNAATPWTLYVSAKVTVTELVLVVNHPVGRHHQLTPQDLRLEERELGRLRNGFLTDPQDVVGLLTRYPLQAGRVIDPQLLMQPKVVQRGQTVTLLAGTDGFEVRSVGLAMRDGARGDLIPVKNLSSNRIVEGKVLDTGTVKVHM